MQAAEEHKAFGVSSPGLVHATTVTLLLLLLLRFRNYYSYSYHNYNLYNYHNLAVLVATRVGSLMEAPHCEEPREGKQSKPLKPKNFKPQNP